MESSFPGMAARESLTWGQAWKITRVCKQELDSSTVETHTMDEIHQNISSVFSRPSCLIEM